MECRAQVCYLLVVAFYQDLSKTVTTLRTNPRFNIVRIGSSFPCVLWFVCCDGVGFAVSWWVKVVGLDIEAQLIAAN